MITDLAERLDLLWNLYDREVDPAIRNRYENLWISLLHRYERACDMAAETTEATAA
ncbi:MAG: hypothetical protein ACR2OU_17230 [Thermomicrobiales bacterium]